MGDLTVTTYGMDARYAHEAPGPWCLSHRSVFCQDVQGVLAARADVDYLAEVIGRSIGQRFSVSFPVYPQFCIWETLEYEGVNHDLLGPMAELVGPCNDRHRVIYRLLPGEGAADLAQSLRDNFEVEVEADIARLRERVPKPPGHPDGLPRCMTASHSIRYQRLLAEMLNPTLLNAEWDALREQTYALYWTFYYYNTCLFCWTKLNMQDAIRVSPDFQVGAASTSHDDLIPDASDTNKRSTDIPW